MARSLFRLLPLPLAAITLLGGCYLPISRFEQHDRPEPAYVLEMIKTGRAFRGTTPDGQVLDLTRAVPAGSMICIYNAEPACVPVSVVTALETREVPGTPWWVHAMWSPLYPVALGIYGVEGVGRVVSGPRQTWSPAWAPESRNSCVRYLRPEADGSWPSDQRVRQILNEARPDLDGACLISMSSDPQARWSSAERLEMNLVGQVRSRFAAFACASPRPEAEAALPRAVVPFGGRDDDWPGHLRRIFADPATYRVTASLIETCADAGGVAVDLGPAIARTREGWPLPENWTP